MMSRSRSGASLFAMLSGLLCAGWLGAGQVAVEDVEYLFQPKEFPKGWTFFSADPAVDPKPSWQVPNREADVKEAVLVCLGKPDNYGYIRTEREFENYELGWEWRYPADPNGNSGFLLHTIDKDMIWPKSLQVQLHRPTAGSVLPHGDAKTDNALAVKDLSKPVGEWNACVVQCDKDRISVTINGKKAGEVTGCTPMKGAIALQSEGSEVHFRRIWIRPLPKTP